MRFARCGWILFVAGGCSRAQTSPVPPAAVSEPVVAAQPVTPASIEPDAGPSSVDDMPAVIVALSPESAERVRAAGACPATLPHDERMRCLYDERYRGDLEAARIALDLAQKWNVLAGTERAHTMDGGYRGKIRLEPALPIAGERRQLEWIAAAFADIERVLAPFEHPDGGQRTKPYRWRSIVLRFVRSVGARTPSAYAHDWTIGWNLAGSLHTSPDAVRETLVHEIFHLNDDAHGTTAQTWSQAVLRSTYDAIVKKCGTRTACLAPYSPGDTMVRGGTYYSFQPGNDVREYAAELALRYFREHRAVARGEPVHRPFKCGPAENARAWALLRDEFFDGIDRVPPCPTLNP